MRWSPYEQISACTKETPEDRLPPEDAAVYHAGSRPAPNLLAPGLWTSPPPDLCGICVCGFLL